MGDRGRIGEAEVLDVQVDAEGTVHHLFEGATPSVGDEVEVAVEALRRRAHMALHTGQHALSRAVLDRLGATTVSSRLGASACTLDVDVPKLTLEALREVQDAVNRLIDEDRPVRQRFVDDAELERLELRKPAPDMERVRVVEIDGFDITPCGGTHTTHTAQIELLFIRSVEAYKGGSRITFEAGPRARDVLLEHAAGLRVTAARLKCAPPEVPEIVEGVGVKLAAAREEAGELRARLAAAWADRLSREPSPIVATIEDGDAALLKAIAARLSEGDRVIALDAPAPEGTHVLIARGPEADVHCGNVLREATAACGGRGGGRPDHAQGRVPADADFGAAVRAQLSAG